MPTCYIRPHQEHVLDETYRKSCKLDAGKFLWGFNPDTGDFASRLASGLFPWGSLDSGIHFELYKLNVYGTTFLGSPLWHSSGKGSFFKAHQDTLSGEDMFGSLVVLIFFDHEGGNLLLRHRGREYTFNASALLRDAPPISVAYATFFSDVEHEVAQITSGHRVTITYNLYFGSKKRTPVIQSPSDAVLIKTMNEFNIKHHFFLLYRESNSCDQHCPFRVLSKIIIEGFVEDAEWAFDVIAGKGSFLVWDDSQIPGRSDWYKRYDWHKEVCGITYESMDVKWLTEPNEDYMDWSAFVAYENQASMGYSYHQLPCVVAIVPNLSGRETKLCL